VETHFRFVMQSVLTGCDMTYRLSIRMATDYPIGKVGRHISRAPQEP